MRKHLIRHRHVQIVVWICFSLCLAVTLFVLGGKISAASRQRVTKVPPQYEDLNRLLTDFQAGVISEEIVLQILILYARDNVGVFLPFRETDTYGDLYYVHKGEHLKLEREKLKRYRQEAR